MKRLISLFLVILMFVSVMPFSANITGASTHGYLKGDANDDTEIDMKDMLLIRKYLADLVTEKDICLIASDLNDDGDVDMKDVLYLKKIIAGIFDLDGNNDDKLYKVDTVTVDKKNISRYTIVIPDDGNECMEYSATELRKYIKQACGVNLNITNDENSVIGYKIIYKWDDDDEFSLGREGYRVTVEENDDVTFYCGSQRGPLYVTYFFLEEIIGYRFLFDDIIYLYESDGIDLPMGYSETEVPVLSYRTPSQRGITDFNATLLKSNGGDGAAYGIAQAKYGWVEGTAWEHAHSYANQMAGIAVGYDSYRQAAAGDSLKKLEASQPCLTSEETYEKIMDYNTKLLIYRAVPSGQIAAYDDNGKPFEGWGRELGKNYTQISCSPNDNTNFCQCSKCKAVYAEEGSIAGTVFRMSNRVAEALEKDFPGIEVFTVAYWDARNPPKFTRPRDNVCVMFCFAGCNNHTYDDIGSCEACGGNPRPPAKQWDGTPTIYSNAIDIPFFEKWSELTNNLCIWYYSCGFNFYLAPSPNVFNVYEDFKYVASHGAKGIYSEGSGNGFCSFEMLRGYLAAKMMWDPFMSEEEFEALLDEFLMIYYGDGWRYIKQYMLMAEECSNLQPCWTNNFDRPWNMYNKEYYAAHYEEMRELFVKAYDAASDAGQRENVKRCSLQCDFLGLSATYESSWLNGSSSEKSVYKQRYTDFYNYIKEHAYDPESSNNTRESIRLADVGEGFAGCLNFPTSADDVRDTMGWIMEDFSGYWEFIGGRWV